MKNEPTLTIVSGIGKDSKKPYQAMMLQIGDWSTMVFPKSLFESKYIANYVLENEITVVPLNEYEQ